MEEYSYLLKDFAWEGEVRIRDLTLVNNGLKCQARSFEEAESAVNLFLDLVAFAREKDVLFQSAHHTYVEHANRLRTFTTEAVAAKPVPLEELKKFLQAAYPRIRQDAFRAQTGVQGALRFYLAAFGIRFFQARYLCMFNALDILLAHVHPPAGLGPLAGLIQAVRQISSIPSGTREFAADRLSAPGPAERMLEFVRRHGIGGVAFQKGGQEETRYRFDELLRIRDEFSRQGTTDRFIHGEGELSLQYFYDQLRNLVRECLLALLIPAKA